MKRIVAIILVALAAAALFAGLVHVVLVASHLSTPAVTTVQGLTPRRLWATAADALALVGVILGGVALSRFARGSGALFMRRGALGALAAGLIAAVNGALNLVLATGGPGSGNGVIGGAGAIVLGLIALTLGCVALVRWRRSAFGPERTA